MTMSQFFLAVYDQFRCIALTAVPLMLRMGFTTSQRVAALVAIGVTALVQVVSRFFASPAVA